MWKRKKTSDRVKKEKEYWTYDALIDALLHQHRVWNRSLQQKKVFYNM